MSRFTDRLGIRFPIVQAPMAGISTAPLVAAVANAGGLGTLGSATMSPETVEAQVRAVRALTSAPFALNFFVHAPPRVDEAAADRMWQRLGRSDSRPALSAPPPFGAAMLERVLALRPAVVSFHFGLPDDASLRAVKDAGIVVLSSATSVAEAKLLAARGVDAVIAQGIEAGGHRGTFAAPPDEGDLGTLALVPRIVDAVDVPVLAAGGIVDGRGIAAVLALGASAAVLGTAFLACPEAVLDPAYRGALSGPHAARTRITRLYSGRPARAIVTPFLEQHAALEGETLDFPLQRALSARLDVAMWAGQAAAAIRELPAAELVATLVRETEAAQRHE